MYGGHPNKSLNRGEFRCLGNFGFRFPKNGHKLVTFRFGMTWVKPFLFWYGILGVNEILPIKIILSDVIF